MTAPIAAVAVGSPLLRGFVHPFYRAWAIVCAGSGYLSASLSPEPLIPGPAEFAAAGLGVLAVAMLEAFAPMIVGRRVAPSLELPPWSSVNAVSLLAAFTSFASGVWAIAFALLQSQSLFRGAFQTFMLGAVLVAGTYLSPVLFASRYDRPGSDVPEARPSEHEWRKRYTRS